VSNADEIWHRGAKLEVRYLMPKFTVIGVEMWA